MNSPFTGTIPHGMSPMLGLPWVPWSPVAHLALDQTKQWAGRPQGIGVLLTSQISCSLMGKDTLILCNSAPWAWDDVSNSQQVFLLLNCFYGQGSKRMKTTFPTQLPQPLISVPGTPQLCFKTMTFDFTSKHSSCRNTSSYLGIWKEGFQASWLAGSLSRFKFLTTWSLKTLSEGLQGQNPFHKNTKIPFLPILMIIKWKVPDITWHVIIPLFWCYYIINVFIIVICGWIDT